MAINKLDISSLTEEEQRKLLIDINRLTKNKKLVKTKTIPKTDDELWQWIVDETGYKIPKVSVCDDHQAPFDFIKDFFFERENALFLLGSRELGKTLMVSIGHYANSELKPGTESCTFGAIEQQAKRAYNHLTGFVYEKDEFGRKKNLKGSIEGEPLKSETKWKNGSKVEILVGSKAGVNSPHPQKVHADEVDLMEEYVWDESRNMSSSKVLINGEEIKAQDIGTSTIKSAKGLVQKILDECKSSEDKGFKPPWRIYRSCVYEAAKEVSSCRRSNKDEREKRLIELGKDPCELCNCHKVAKGEWSQGVPRTLDSVCKGKLFKSRGWMGYEDIVRKFMQNTPNVWVAQMECRRPMMDGLYLPSYSREKHNVSYYEPKPEYGYIWTTTDWGGTEDSIVLWIQGPLNRALEIPNTRNSTTIVPQGAFIIFEELRDASMGASRLADKVVRIELGFKTRFKGWRVKGRFADMAGKMQRQDWHQHNPPLRTSWPVGSREVDPQIEHLQALMTDDLIYVYEDKCPGICDDFESWHQKNGKESHDESSHGPAACRYGFINIKTIMKRLRKTEGMEHFPTVYVPEKNENGTYKVGELESERWRNSLGPMSPNWYPSTS